MIDPKTRLWRVSCIEHFNGISGWTNSSVDTNTSTECSTLEVLFGATDGCQQVYNISNSYSRDEVEDLIGGAFLDLYYHTHTISSVNNSYFEMNRTANVFRFSHHFQ